MRLCRVLLAVIIFIWGSLALSQSRSLLVERRGEQLYFSAPQLHFLQGKAIEKLHNGSTVAYVIALSVIAESTKRSLFTLRDRFLVSFDLWEEKYSVVQGKPDGRSASRLTATMAEAWCFESLPMPVRAVPEQQQFMIRLECSIDESETENWDKINSTLTLAGLIDIFSRKSGEPPLRWEASAGPLRLGDVKNGKPVP